MPTVSRSVGIAAMSAAFFLLPASVKADGHGTSEKADKAWEFVIAPYALAPFIAGDSTIGRLPGANLSVTPGTILENLHMGGMLHLEALYNNRFGAIFDIAYMNLGSSTTTPITGGRLRAKIKQTVVEGYLTYAVFNDEKTRIDAYAGGRYWNLDIDFAASGTIAGSFNFNPNTNWFDPVIGFRAIHRFNETWSARAQGDIGGLGAGSDFTWLLQAGVGYHFNETWSLHAQYKALSVDYDNGKSGASRFTYDTITHGPLLGVAARF